MSSLRLVLRGLQGYWRTHLGALATAAVVTAVIVAALGVGDSVRESLAEVAQARTGRVTFAAHARDRMWRQDLAGRLAQQFDTAVSAVLRLNGSIALPDGSARVARVRVLGVDDAFWSLSPGGRPPLSPWPESGVALSERVAARLGASVGDLVIVRVERPAPFSRDAPMSSDAHATAQIAAEVVAVLDARAFGAFALEIGQLPPANVFLPLGDLQDAVGEPDRANTLLTSADAGGRERIAAAATATWQLDDAGLSLHRLEGERGWELRSRRVFVDPAAADAALACRGAWGVLTWLVNDMAVRDRHTPYSLVAALPREHILLPDDLQDDEIVVNAWLARDLGAQEGDTATLTYYVLGHGRRLAERTAEFRIRGVVPLEGAAADRELMPPWPGLSAANSCREWDAGFALDLGRIRDVDETYWDEHGGTPKAFIGLGAGQRLWENRFGTLTAVRFPPETDPSAIRMTIRARLEPAAFGLSFVDLERTRAQAIGQGMDFGALFLGFSGLLVIAALLLLGLVVALNVAMRQEEIATLRALGFAPRRVRRIFALEHAIVALAGGLVGAVGSVPLEAVTLGTLSTVWSDVAGSLPMALVVRPGTVIAGTAAGAAVSFGAAFLALWPALRGSVLDAFTRSEELAVRHARTRARRCYGGGVALLFAVVAVILALRAGTGRDPATAGAFFGSGALLLCAALSFVWYALGHVGVAREGRRLGTWGLVWRDLGRRRGRSLATIGILAFGVFMFFGVTVFRRDRLRVSDDPASGTGGFALVGESSVAVTHHLDTPEGRRFYGLTDADLAGVRVVHLRVRQGDDASCRSLARAQAPEVVGVDPRALAGRFSFLQTANPDGDPWDVLRPEALKGEATPAVIDQATMWTLGKGIGDEVALVDEHGRPFTARIRGVIDNAVLHGHLIVSETAFEERYPSEAGYRRFLVDAPASRVDAVAARLSRQLEDRGLSLERTEVRLNAYNAVENTYLGIFQALGGLALLLGSVGLALVVARNTIERRAEFALLGAVGFARRRVVRLVAAEHAVLLGVGLLAGVAAAVLSILPVLATPGARVVTPRMGLVLLALGTGGMLWTLLAAHLALRGPHLQALHRE